MFNVNEFHSRTEGHRRLFILSIFLCCSFLFGLASSVASAGQPVTLKVRGEAWDSCSRGFAFFGGLSQEEAFKTAARRGARVSVDGQPEIFAVTGQQAKFQLTFSTDKPTFRLVVEGDRFPRLITQPFKVPAKGGEIDVGRVTSPRAEGTEHSWPLEKTAEKLGYPSTLEMLADNKAAIRILVRGSGEEGTPGLANDTQLVLGETEGSVMPFTMDARDSHLQLSGPRLGAFIAIVSFSPGDPSEKNIVLNVSDTVSEPSWNPPRPWGYDPVTVTVRNGFATEVDVEPRLE